MKSRTKKEYNNKEDIQIRRSFWEDLKEQYMDDRVDDMEIINYVSNELKDLEKNESKDFNFSIKNLFKKSSKIDKKEEDEGE